MSLFILRAVVCSDNSNAGVDLGFVDIKSVAVDTKNFERQSSIF